MMDWTTIIPAVACSSVLSAAVSGYYTSRRMIRSADLTSEAKVREDLRAVIREERGEHRACEEEVRQLRGELLSAKVNEAILRTQVGVLETQMAEIRQAFLRKYMSEGSTPPSVST